MARRRLRLRQNKSVNGLTPSSSGERKKIMILNGVCLSLRRAIISKELSVWVRGFRELGTRWGVLRNLSDIPYFASTRESRLLQLADFVSHSIFLLYERADVDLAKSIVHRMDQKDGRIHGLVHISARKGIGCDCPVCASRRTPYNFGRCS